jgi:hypothetical protein
MWHRSAPLLISSKYRFPVENLPNSSTARAIIKGRNPWLLQTIDPALTWLAA